ncbi:hypothetical protein MMC13_003490 [Lambiella insularis]|nr:hypothetical protein [Lambiella insularis]
MAAGLELGALQDLQQDLVALSTTQLQNVEKLWLDLEANIDALRRLLDKPERKETSRASLLSGMDISGFTGTIEIDGNKYAINDEFREGALQLAEGLELDELDSAHILLLVQEEARSLDRSPVAYGVLHFHSARESLLDCLRLILKESQAIDCEEEVRSLLLQGVTLILETKDGPARNGSLFVRKCVAAMSECEKWLQSIIQRAQNSVTLGMPPSPEFAEILDVQQSSLQRQHEALGAITTLLIKGGYTNVEDFYRILDHMKTMDRWGETAVHYVPILISLISQYGSMEGSVNLRESRSVNNRIIKDIDSQVWALPNLQAAMTTWWLAEYSGWYFEQPTGSPLQGVNLEAEAQTRSETFFQALHDGAFQCSLSIISQCKPNDWSNPAKTGLTQSLLGDTIALSLDSASTTPGFQELLIEQFENFTTAFITNMPDTLRRFKVEEDDQRRKMLSGIQANLPNGLIEQDGHLERFLLIMSYAYENRPEAAESFWTDADSNLYGFLQWASRKQSTPCISAFCEFFRAISVGHECASAAHSFLLDESSTTSSRHRRSITLSWSQILEELDLYASRIGENPGTATTSSQSGPSRAKPVGIDEPESPVMLECYLRLITHLCIQSPEIRLWILAHPTFRLVDTLFSLSSSTVPARVRACAYNVLQALLIEKDLDFGYNVWTALDHWVSTGFPQSIQTIGSLRPVRATNATAFTDEYTFEIISSSFEEANAFVSLLQALISPPVNTIRLNDALPFPEQLGSSYRMQGAEPYVDLAFGRIFVDLLRQLGDPSHIRILALSVLRFIIKCLTSFNEDLIMIANNSKISVEENIRSSSLLAYVCLHPFSRTVEWLFNDGVLAVLFSLAHQDPRELSKSLPDSPLVLALSSTIEVMSLVMDLQSTYLDIVRPSIKLNAGGRRRPVSNPSLASFEDSVAGNLQIIVDLGLYCGSGHENLAIASLDLLRRLCTSRKLNAIQTSKIGSKLGGNRLVGVLQRNNDAEAISRSLIEAMGFDAQEIASGPMAPGYSIKVSIFDFLDATLKASPEKPNVAHVLLGFESNGDSLVVRDDGLFVHGSSLFHAVLRLVVEYPNSIDGTMLSWSLALKLKGLHVLRTLWSSSLTSAHTLAQLKEGDFLAAMWLRQTLIDPSTSWSGLSIHDTEFCTTDDSIQALDCCLGQRRSLLELASTEIRLLAAEDPSVYSARMMSTILGSSATEHNGVSNLTVLDLLDFLELEVMNGPVRPETRLLTNLDLTTGTELNPDGSILRYNLMLVEEILELQRSTLIRSGRIVDTTTESDFEAEACEILLYLKSENSSRQVMRSRMLTLRSWVDLATLVLESKDIESPTRGALALQALQVLSPKLELYASAVRPDAILIARFAQTMLAQLGSLKPLSLENGRTGDVASDRLFQFFRISLQAIQNPESNEVLREALYNVCFRYLVIDDNGPQIVIRRQHITRTVKAAGPKLIDTVSDDAYGGEGTCRVAALLLLDVLTDISTSEKSNYMVESFVRTNFVVVLVESINDIPHELISASSNDVPLLIAGYEAKFSLLLTISQSRTGATHVMNAGIFAAIRSSGLFATDLDLGLEIDNPQALHNYHLLLLAVIRIVTSVVMSRGPQNEQTIDQARGFLTEYRPLMVATFKRQAILGDLAGGYGETSKSLADLLEYFVLLISLTGFLEFEGSRDARQTRRTGFS